MEIICLPMLCPVEFEQASLRCFVVAAAFLVVMLVVSLMWVRQCLGIVTDLAVAIVVVVVVVVAVVALLRLQVDDDAKSIINTKDFLNMG
jgi:hypothetical protein